MVSGILLSLINLVVWGSWPSIRMYCNADGPVFAPLYFFGQWISALVLGLCLDPLLLSKGLSEYYDPMKVFCLIFGGYAISNADFLCACACTRIPFSIAFPVYAGYAMAQGMVLTYFLIDQGSGLRPELLFPGVILAVAAIICLALADAFSKKDTSDDLVLNSTENPINPSSETTNSYKPLSTSKSNITVPQTYYEKIVHLCKSINKWVYICLFAGFFGSMWSPISNYGRSAPNGVMRPYTALFLFQTGQLLCVPFAMDYYAEFFDDNNPQKVQIKVTPYLYVQRLWALPLKDKLFGLLAGSMVGIGYTLYYTSSSEIAPTIALGIASCEPLMTIFIAVVIERQLRSATYLHKVFMVSSTVCFVLAIFLMSFSAK